MVRAWKSLWYEKSGFEERNFTTIFISHIDNAIHHNELWSAVDISQCYVDNIEQRNPFFVSYQVLPKVLEWNETFWNKEQDQKDNENIVDFWNWDYFHRTFFPPIIRTVFQYRDKYYKLFFSALKNHVEASEKKLATIKDEEQKEEYFHYIPVLFQSFCSTIFNEIKELPSNYKLWEHYFPQEWQMSTTESPTSSCMSFYNGQKVECGSKQAILVLMNI